METIKKSIGLGSEYPVESGQEPVSGEIGQGTATEPYDSGNLPEAERGGLAPQHTPVNGEPTAATEALSSSGAGGAAATDNAVDSAGDGGLPSSQLPGSKAAAPPVEKPDYSDAPLKPAEGTQHRRSSIPTAGGVAVGSVASEAREERRRSVDARRKSRETGSSVDRPGSGGIPEEQVPALPTQTQTDPSATTAAAPEAAAAPTTTSTTTSEPAQQESNAGGAPTTELPVDPSPRTSISQAKPTTAEVVPVNGGVSDGTAIPSQAPVASEPESKAATSPEGATETTKEGRRKSFFGKIKEKLKN